MHPHIGGIEQTTRDIIDSLKDDEHRIICFNHEKRNRRDQVDGVDVFRCAVALKVASQAVSFSFNRILKKELKSMNPDLVIFHYPNPFEAHYLLKYLKKNSKTNLILLMKININIETGKLKCLLVFNFNGLCCCIIHRMYNPKPNMDSWKKGNKKSL